MFRATVVVTLVLDFTDVMENTKAIPASMTHAMEWFVGGINIVRLWVIVLSVHPVSLVHVEIFQLLTTTQILLDSSEFIKKHLSFHNHSMIFASMENLFQIMLLIFTYESNYFSTF